MPYLFGALILTNVLWFIFLMVFMRSYEMDDPMDAFSKASDIAATTVRDVTAALTREFKGDPAANHGAYPPGDHEQFSLPEMDYSDPNDGMYLPRMPGKLLENGDMDFLHPEAFGLVPNDGNANP